MKKIDSPKFIIFDCFETIVNNDLSAWKNLFGSFIDENKWEIETEKLWELWKSKEINFREIRTNLKDLNSNPPFKSYEKAWSDCFKKVFEELSKRYSKRNGGYSRVLKAGFRTGDDAPMAVIELVDRNTEARKIDKPKKVKEEDKKQSKEIPQKTVAK